MQPISFKASEYNVAEISREQYNQMYGRPSVNVPVESENPFSTQRVRPVERTGEVNKPEQTNRYVEDQNLFASINSIGTGEISPKKYDEFTGNRLDIMG